MTKRGNSRLDTRKFRPKNNVPSYSRPHTNHSSSLFRHTCPLLTYPNWRSGVKKTSSNELSSFYLLSLRSNLSEIMPTGESRTVQPVNSIGETFERVLWPANPFENSSSSQHRITVLSISHTISPVREAREHTNWGVSFLAKPFQL